MVLENTKLKTKLNTVLVETRENIGIVTMNQPEKRNYFSPEMGIDLVTAFAELRDDDSIDVVITTGAGVAWSAGMSGQRLIGGYEAGQRGERGSAASSYSVSEIEMVRTFPKVTIAAVNGYCLGHAFHFYNMHDLGIASEEKARFGLPEVFRGFPPGPLASSCIPAMTPKWAFDMVLTGENWDARTAQLAGVVTRIVPHAQLMESAFQWAKEISRSDRVTMEYIKKQYRAAMEEPIWFKCNQAISAIGAEHNRVNRKSFEGMRDFLGKTGRKATDTIKWVWKT